MSALALSPTHLASAKVSPRRAVRVTATQAGKGDGFNRRTFAFSAALVAGAAVVAELSVSLPAKADVEFATSSTGLQWADVTVGDGNPPTQVKKKTQRSHRNRIMSRKSHYRALRCRSLAQQTLLAPARCSLLRSHA